MATTTLTSNGILVRSFSTADYRSAWETESLTPQEREKRVSATTRKYEICEPMGLSPFEPIGEFLLAVLDAPPAWGEWDGDIELIRGTYDSLLYYDHEEDQLPQGDSMAPQLGGEYERWLDDVDSSQYDIPEDF